MANLKCYYCCCSPSSYVSIYPLWENRSLWLFFRK